MATVYEFNSPPIKGSAWSFEMSLVSQADTDQFQANPTLAAGDVKVIQAGTLDGNIDALPVAVAGCTHVITVTLSAAEMNANRVTVAFRDAAGAEWQDATVTIFTVAAVTLPATQDVRDAMKLAPTAGAPAADSVDSHLDDILADTGEIGVAGAGLTALGDVRIANLDATVSSRSTVAQVNVVLARLGAFTGAGLNTVLGFLRAMARKTAALTPSDMGGTFNNVTDSLEAIRDKLSSSTITVTGPVVNMDGDAVTYRGDTYLNEDGRALEWESDDWPDLTGGSVVVIINKVAQFNGSVVTPVGTVKVRLELTATQSRSIPVGRYNFQVVATQSDGDVATLVDAAWVSRARSAV